MGGTSRWMGSVVKRDRGDRGEMYVKHEDTGRMWVRCGKTGELWATSGDIEKL